MDAFKSYDEFMKLSEEDKGEYYGALVAAAFLGCEVSHRFALGFVSSLEDFLKGEKEEL